MRVAVVDDLRMDAENLRGMLDRRLRSGTFIDLYASGEAFLASQSRYDLIFLDIVMEGMDGIETARQLRARDMDCLIVFLTSSREYVWEAFPMHAFDYLVKPVEQERLDRVLEEAQRALACQERMLSLKVGRHRAGILPAPCQRQGSFCVRYPYRRSGAEVLHDLWGDAGHAGGRAALSGMQPGRADQHGPGALL